MIEGILNSKGKIPKRTQEFKSIFGIENQSPIQLAGDKKQVSLKYRIYGPYEIPFEKIRSKPRVITPGDVESLWQDIENKRDSDLKDKRGIYIYALRKTKLTIPWFIGSSSENTTLGNQAFCSYRDMYAINKIFTESYGKTRESDGLFSCFYSIQEPQIISKKIFDSSNPYFWNMAFKSIAKYCQMMWMK